MQRCPSCNATIEANSKFCNECGYNLLQDNNASVAELQAKRSYKLRSPILESAILYEDTSEKKHGFLAFISYSFWVFSLAFLIYGVATIYKNYTVDLLKSIMDASVMFAISVLCFMLPGLINILIEIEENLSFLAKEAKRDKIN